MTEGAPPERVVLVSGLSGAGKASTLRALEDLGFEAVDNPPLSMIEEMVRRSALPTHAASVDQACPPARRLAIGVDARTNGFDAAVVLATLARLRADPVLRPLVASELLFVWAEDSVLLRRFTETRRRHPLAESGRVQDGIAAEQRLTAELREAADFVIDTSDMPLSELRRLVEARYGGGLGGGSDQLALTLVSFAFPVGLPRESDMVFDARFLRNPHYVTSLRPLTGLDDTVGQFVEADPDYAAFFGRVRDLMDLLLPRFVAEGKKYVTVSVGCTGGRHRSVHVVERLASYLVGTGWHVNISHRELMREGWEPPRAGRSPAIERLAAESIRAQGA